MRDYQYISLDQAHKLYAEFVKEWQPLKTGVPFLDKNFENCRPKPIGETGWEESFEKFLYNECRCELGYLVAGTMAEQRHKRDEAFYNQKAEFEAWRDSVPTYDEHIANKQKGLY